MKLTDLPQQLQEWARATPADQPVVVPSHSGLVQLATEEHGEEAPRTALKKLIPEARRQLDQEDVLIVLEGPDNFLYWGAWESICNTAIHAYDVTTMTPCEVYCHGEQDIWLGTSEELRQVDPTL